MEKILIKFLKPALEIFIEEINAGNYYKVYGILVLVFIILYIAISILNWVFLRKKIKSEISKNTEDSKSKALKNLKDLQGFRNKYLENSIFIQMAIDDISKAMNLNNETEIKNIVENARDMIFNDLIDSFEDYLDAFEIVYSDQKKRFIDVFEEFLSIVNVIVQIMAIINEKQLLQRTGLVRYEIQPYVFKSMMNYFKRNLSWYRICKRRNINRLMKEMLKK